MYMHNCSLKPCFWLAFRPSETLQSESKGDPDSGTAARQGRIPFLPHSNHARRALVHGRRGKEYAGAVQATLSD